MFLSTRICIEPLILLSLAFNADAHGVCWPSVQTVARKCAVSSRTVQRTIQELIADGLLQAHVRFRADEIGRASCRERV